MSFCPRCESTRDDCRVEMEGKEDGQLVWTIFHCGRCSFTWRDTELPESIDINQRDPWFKVDPDDPDRYVNILPPTRP